MTVTAQTKGIDTFGLISGQCWKSMTEQGISFAAIRIYDGSGDFDAAGLQSLNNAFTAGYPKMSVTVYPCKTCGGARQQGRDIRLKVEEDTLLGGTNSKLDKFYVMVDRLDLWDYDSFDSNRMFLETFMGELSTAGVIKDRLEIYSTNQIWSQAFGDGYYYPFVNGTNGGAAQGLVYGDENQSGQSKSSFTPFGGWSAPKGKRLLQPTTLPCKDSHGSPIANLQNIFMQYRY